MKLLLLLFSTLLLTNSFSQSDLELLHLQPGVKSLHKRKYTADEKGRLIPSFREDLVMRFNEKGMKLYEEAFFGDSSVSHSISFSYQDDSLLTGQIYKTAAPETDELKLTYEFDQAGRISIVSSYPPEGGPSCTYYSYDEKGNRTGVKMDLSEGVNYTRFAYEFDDGENCTKILRYKDDTTLFSTHVYHYDNQGNKVRESWTYPDGTVEVIRKNTFDNHGNVIRQEVFDRYGTLLKQPLAYPVRQNAVLTFEYVYDDHGNPVRETLFDDGEISSVITRTLLY